MIVDFEGKPVVIGPNTNFRYSRSSLAFAIGEGELGRPLYWSKHKGMVDDKFSVGNNLLTDGQAYSVMEMLACALGFHSKRTKNSAGDPMLVLSEPQDFS